MQVVRTLVVVFLVALAISGCSQDAGPGSITQGDQDQLEAALNAVAPALDMQLVAASARLRQLQANPALRSAIEGEDWPAVDKLIAGTATPGYVTDTSGTVVAGARPVGALVEQPGMTTARFMRSTDVLATLHVPAVVDRSFLVQRVQGGRPAGIDVVVADERTMVSTGANDAVPRPADLRAGVHELSFGGPPRTALMRAMLDGRILVGAMLPAS